jgi:hypothetical protein
MCGSIPVKDLPPFFQASVHIDHVLLTGERRVVDLVRASAGFLDQLPIG